MCAELDVSLEATSRYATNDSRVPQAKVLFPSSQLDWYLTEVDDARLRSREQTLDPTRLHQDVLEMGIMDVAWIRE